MKKTNFKTWLTACCCLIVVLSQAQTGNPYWNLPPSYLNYPTLTSLPTNSYTWTQSGSTVTPGYGNDSNAIWNSYPGTALTDKDGITIINGPSNMQMDENNNPLFSIVSGYIFNKNGYLIDTLVDTITVNQSGSAAKVRAVISGYTEVCVVPNPANCQQYYVFTAMPVSAATYDQNSDFTYTHHYGAWYNINANGCYGHPPYGNNVVIPYYTLLDVSQQGSYMPSGQYGKNLKPGAVGNATAKNLYTVTSVTAPCGVGHTPFYGDIHYAATSVYGKGSNAYRLLFVINDAEILTYKITGTGSDGGVQFLNSQAIGVGAGFYTNTFTNVTELELYQAPAIYDAIELAFGAPNGSVGNNTLILCNYDTTGKYIPSSTTATYTYTGSGIFDIEGIEFSPDGSKLYVAHTSCTQYPSTVDEIILSTGSVVPVSYSTAYEHSQIEKGTDGNLYLIQDSTVLRQITTPNATGTISTTTLSLGTSQRVYPAHLEGYEYEVSNGLGSLINSNIMPTNTLPDQIDQDTYSNILTGACCLFYQNYDKYTYAAGTAVSTWTNTSSSQTWGVNTNTTTPRNPIALSTNTTRTVTIGEELRIPAGMTITIDSMTIQFSPQARLIIENGYSSKSGGKLILNACTLTVKSVCTTDMWPGVQVWGSPSQTQNSTNQGWLQTNSNCVIENAYVGVLAGYDTSWLSRPRTPIPPFTTVPSGDFTQLTNSGGQGGGIIECSNTKFLNNQRHVVFYSYNSTTATSAIPKLYECTFKNTNLLTHTQHNHYYVGMVSYTPVNIFPIEGCAFVDTVSVNYVDTGLFTVNSAYNVEQVVGGSPYVRTSFSNFGYGIFSISIFGNAATFSATNSNFFNNYYGIYAGGVNNIIVETDTFKIFTTTCSRCTKPNAYGLYIDNATGYSVRDNYFGRYSVLNTNNLYGIVANNTGQHNNRIFRNTFANLYVGNQAQYINYVRQSTAPHNGNGGLVYLCNTFNASTITNADIYVPSSTGTNVGIGTGSTADSSGVYYEQGTGGTPGAVPTDPNYPVTGGNQFSHTSGGYDFYIDTNALAYHSNYYWCNGSGTGCGTAFQPIKTKNCGTSGVSSAVTCSVNTYTCSGCRALNPLEAMQNQADAIKQTYDSLAALIDGGSTTGLLMLVNGNNNHQAVLNSLIQAAPYLSEGVLTAYINSNYPTNDITQVLTACSPLTDETKAALNVSNLSSGIKSQISSLQNSVSKLTQLRLSMGSVLSARHMILDDLIRTYIRDTVQTNVQLGYTLMKTEAMELPARSQFETALSLGDSVMAANALAQVANQEGQSNYVTLSTLLLQNLSNSNIMQNNSVVGTLQTMAADSSDRLVYMKVNTMLQSVGKSKYIPYIQPFPKADTTTQDQAARTTQVAPVAPTTLSASSLYNSPNPFKESTVVKAVIVEKTQNAYIVITDMVGNELARYPVQQGENNITVNAGNLDQAMMFCTLVVDGVKIKTNKMVLIK